LEIVHNCWGGNDSTGLAHCLCVGCIQPDSEEACFAEAMPIFVEFMQESQIQTHINQFQFSNISLAHITSNHLKAVMFSMKGQFKQAYEHQEKVQLQLQTNLREDGGAWLIPAFTITTNSTRLIAIKADCEIAQSDRNDDDELDEQKNELLERFAMKLQKVFAVCLQDKEPDLKISRKRGVLYIVNTLCNIYFRCHKMNLCENLTKRLEPPPPRPGGKKLQSQVPPAVFEQLPKRDRVTYRYYTGRMALMKDNYKVAERDLDYACAHCHRER
jgi:hypothetical protein